MIKHSYYICKSSWWIYIEIIAEYKDYRNEKATLNAIKVADGIWFNPCDFQEEGLTAAIIGWASKAFGFEQPIINVSFQKEKNRYHFEFNE